MNAKAGAFFIDVRALLLTAVALLTAACLVPPEGQSSRDPFAPGLLDANRVIPSLGVHEVSAGDDPSLLGGEAALDGRCESVSVRVPGIFDIDSDTLLLRLVANNGTSEAEVIDDDPERTDDGGRIPEYRIDFDPINHFRETIIGAARLGPRPATLTLFITDGLAWAATADDIVPDNDFSQVIGEGAKVSRVSWYFLFTKDEAESCPD